MNLLKMSRNSTFFNIIRNTETKKERKRNRTHLKSNPKINKREQLKCSRFKTKYLKQ